MNRLIRNYKYLTVVCACAFALLLTLGGCAGNFKSHVSTKDVSTKDVMTKDVSTKDVTTKDVSTKDVMTTNDKVTAKKGVIASIHLTADGRLILRDSNGKTSEKVDPTKITDILPLLKDVGAITRLNNIALLETKSSPRRLKICIDGMCYCFEIKEHNGTATIGPCR